MVETTQASGNQFESSPLSEVAAISLQDVSIWSLPTDCTALVHAFLASFSVIIVSELGDKTFIITAIMAMKNSRLPVFLASAAALLLMTTLSVGMGVAVTVIPEFYTHYVSIILFLCFGLKMLKEAYDMGETAGEESEFDEVKRSLEEEEQQQRKEDEKSSEKGEATGNKENPKETNEVISLSASEDSQSTLAKADQQKRSNLVQNFVSTLKFAPLFMKVFTMIFVAEWGDRSQISTVILAAREDVVGVFVGSFIGHVLCTGLAVIGGRFVAEMISVRTMTLLGGIIFLCFAGFEIISGP